ncbi:disease resistance protein RUN1-like [Syzygium oleosum]|uniref:disease resistance protein RUN1-like n=1 Tax=Syzygium oleosum TaxID=219896 RepID=UPI0011D1FA11|nr:disease resistance protein RUN1-like [Syzygium oleosum]XP_030464821.1 disease resistance protein RUN1-like [Syzygium oleosum]
MLDQSPNPCVMNSEEQNFEASSSSTPPHGGDNEGGDEQKRGIDYEVFLSFRGTDTRTGFTDHLYTNLIEAGIHVFRDDDELRVGDEIGPELISSITQSKISIPIISENYASSKWCLRELAQILKCKRGRGQIVLPIFYKVEPSQVRHLTGGLRDAINAHKKNLDKMIVKEWEEALREVSSLKGWESEKIDNGHEAILVKMVVGRVMSELKRLFQLNVPEQLVGIDDHVEQIMSKMDSKFNGTWIIGIYGMGGIGKTTLAKVLYNKLSSQFEGRSFVANIRETSQREGIKFLQMQLISSITRKPCDVSNVDEGIGIIKSQFTSKKCLILLDDMDDNTQLKALARDGSWFKAGSIVIITTRNKSILDEARASYMYQLNELPLDQSLILFSRHAFGEDSPPSDYEVLSHDVVSTTGGLPLALEIIGSSLCGKAIEAWKDASKKLKNVLDKKVQESLRISYDALDEEVQQIFLDIACFFNGSSKQIPTYMWDACNFFPGKGIEALSLMSLIKIDKDGKIMMHDQLRDLGREIVRLENQEKPQKRSRLWNKEEAEDVLDNNKGTCKIEALQIGNGWGKSYTCEQFKELANLRFLQMEFGGLTGDFQNLLPNLRWLQWQTPWNFAAANFQPKKLVVLDLSGSGISDDWRGWGPLKMAAKLKVLNLSKCHYLRRTPDVSAFKSLEILNLEDCGNLEEIHPSLEDIGTLLSLNVRRCRRLKEIPAGVGRMEELRELFLDGTAIQEIHISRGCLMKLETLSASWCKRLAQLPELMGPIVSLTQLNLSISGIKKLPESMGSLISLTLLDLSQTRIKRLPKSIGSLKELVTLDLSDCASLVRLPSSTGHLAYLQCLLLRGCLSLTEIPDSIGKLASLTKLNLRWTSITELPESIGNLQNLRILDIRDTRITKLPGAIGMREGLLA